MAVFKFPATMILRQQVTSAPYSSHHPNLHTPHWQALACQRHSDIASSFCAPPFEVPSDTSATQMWRGTRRGNRTDLSRDLFSLFLQTNRCWIRPGRNVGHQQRKSNFWKSSWLLKEIVSHVDEFKRPYKNKRFKGRSNQKAYNHDDNFRWVTLKSLKYVPALASALSLAYTHLVCGGNP